MDIINYSIPNDFPTLVTFGFYQRGMQGIVDKISVVVFFSKQELRKFLRAGSLNNANSL